MSREVFVWDEVQQKVVLREDRTPRPSKGPSVISDYIPPLKHMATGKITESKSHFRAMTKATGCVEVGTDPAALRAQKKEPPPITDYVDSVKKALADLNR